MHAWISSRHIRSLLTTLEQIHLSHLILSYDIIHIPFIFLQINVLVSCADCRVRPGKQVTRIMCEKVGKERGRPGLLCPTVNEGFHEKQLWWPTWKYFRLYRGAEPKRNSVVKLVGFFTVRRGRRQWKVVVLSYISSSLRRYEMLERFMKVCNYIIEYIRITLKFVISIQRTQTCLSVDN